MAKADSQRASGYDSYSHTHVYEKPAFQYFIILSIIATLIVSITALANTYKIKNAVVPKTVNANDFLKRLTSHSELKSYVGVAPLNVIQVNNNNFANLQSQIQGLDASYIGNFIVQYSDRIVVYDFDNDKVKGNVNLNQQQALAQLTADIFTKLNKHPELKGLESQKPVGGQLDAASLNTLKQQFPDVYKDAKAGDFLLRYQTRLIIYDYAGDKIINSVNLS